ncbi:MAG: hypothetical protein GY737_28575 [Desulfobacteraceae bacterium]|nr:hypothetical protein [Desulfobacteraceae bacterium]
MKYEDILPILVLIIYVALVFAKHRKIKSDQRKKPVPKGAPKVESRETASQKPVAAPEQAASKTAVSPEKVAPKPAARFDRPAPKLLSVIGERVRRFFAEMEQQFREELERARTQGQAPSMDGTPFFEYREEPMEPEPGEPVPEPEPFPVAYPAAHVAPDKLPGARHRSRCFRDRCRSRQQIRNAVVWSEILEPPLALRQGKRPWEL